MERAEELLLLHKLCMILWETAASGPIFAVPFFAKLGQELWVVHEFALHLNMLSACWTPCCPGGGDHNISRAFQQSIHMSLCGLLVDRGLDDLDKLLVIQRRPLVLGVNSIVCVITEATRLSLDPFGQAPSGPCDSLEETNICECQHGLQQDHEHATIVQEVRHAYVAELTP
jgi:hypothetical protein